MGKDFPAYHPPTQSTAYGPPVGSPTVAKVIPAVPASQSDRFQLRPVLDMTDSN